MAIRVTQDVEEIIYSGNPSIRVTQAVEEVIFTGTPFIRITQFVIETLNGGDVYTTDSLNSFNDSVAVSLVSNITPLTLSVTDSANNLSDSIAKTLAAIGLDQVSIGEGGFNTVYIGSNLVFVGSDFSNALSLSDGFSVLYKYILSSSDSFSLSDAVSLASNNIALSFADSFLFLDSISTSYIQDLFLAIIDSLLFTDSSNFNPVILSNPREIRNNGNNDFIGTCLVVFKDYSAGTETMSGTCVVVFKDYSAGTESTPGTCVVDFYNVIP